MKDNTDVNVEGQEFIVTRVFEAPRDLVFQTWTNPEHLKNWWGPPGFTMDVSMFDLQPEGSFHYRLRDEEGHEMWAKFVFREIAAPEKLVFVTSFSDPEGNIVRAPFSELIPLEILYSVTFTEQDNQTTMNMKGVPIHSTEEEVQFFQSMHTSMQEGFGASFAQLSEYLTKLK